jgi:broad specificity phosphatase PhoE
VLPVADGAVVAVSHVSPIKAAVCWALGIDEGASWRMQLGVAAVTRIGASPDGRPYLHSFNETAHVLAASAELLPNESHESGASA